MAEPSIESSGGEMQRELKKAVESALSKHNIGKIVFHNGPFGMVIHITRECFIKLPLKITACWSHKEPQNSLISSFCERHREAH